MSEMACWGHVTKLDPSEEPNKGATLQISTSILITYNTSVIGFVVNVGSVNIALCCLIVWLSVFQELARYVGTG